MFTTIIKKLRINSKNLVAGLLVGALLVLPASSTIAGYSTHDQPAYDYNVTADRAGSMNGVVFNNFINTPSYGNERAFHTVRATANTSEVGQHRREVSPGDRLTLRAYIHNNANPGTNDDGTGVAEDTRISFFIPTATGTNLRSLSYLSTNPDKVAEGYKDIVSDTVDYVSDTPVQLDFIEGSARLRTNHFTGNGIALGDEIIQPGDDGRGGVLIGYDELNGEIPGCFEFEGIVTLEVEVLAPDVEFEKTAAVVGSGSGYEDVVNAKPGDVISWSLYFINREDDDADGVAHDVRIRDQLPPYLDLVPGSIVLVDGARPDGYELSDTGLFGDGGVLTGSYAPGASGYITFRTTVNDDFAACNAELTNTMFMNLQGYDEESDTAIVNVTKEDCNFSCDQLTKEFVRENTYLFNMKATANEAEVEKFVIDYGDGTVEEITEFTVQDENMYLASVEHTYGEKKAYEISFKVVTSDGEATSELCEESITVAGEEEPTELPNTGPAATVAAVVGTGALGQAARMFVLSRRRLAETLLNR